MFDSKSFVKFVVWQKSLASGHPMWPNQVEYRCDLSPSLKVESQKSPVEMIVVHHVEKSPAEN